MLKIHHLGHSQSERIVWLCEELALPYELVQYTRDAVTRLSPPALRALHPLGAAPVLQDDGLQLAESAAIVEYIIVVHGGGRLKLEPPHPDYAAYLYWTAADIMTVFSLTTMRLFQPFDLAAHPNIRAYLQRIGSRAAYRRAMEKGDPDLVPMLE